MQTTFFIKNRQKLRSLLPKDSLCVVTANGLVQRTGDTVYPFRQDNNFFYLTGIQEPDCLLVMAGDEEWIILPRKNYAETIFGGAIDCDNIAKISGIKTIQTQAEGWARLNKLLQSRIMAHTIISPPERVTHTDSFYTNPARKRLCQKLKRQGTNLDLVDLRTSLTQLRQVKEPDEIKAIQAAIAITKEGLMEVTQMAKPGVYEYEAKAVLDYVFQKHNAAHSFTPIVATSKNASILHYLGTNSQLQKNDLLFMDIGAEVDNYAADISRTYRIGKAISTRHQEVQDSVWNVYNSVFKILKAGISWRDVAVQADEYMGEELIALGLIKKNTRKQVRRYFSHAIGHSLGLDAHDVCDYSGKLQANMVITLEPGIYIPEEQIGIRIEDDLLITANGVKNLSKTITY